MAPSPHLTLGLSIVPHSSQTLAYVLVRGLEGVWSGFQYQQTFSYPGGIAEFLGKAFDHSDVSAFVKHLPSKNGIVLPIDDKKAAAFGFVPRV